MATPSSSETSPSPALSFALPATASEVSTEDSAAIEQADRDERRKKILARAELGKVSFGALRVCITPFSPSWERVPWLRVAAGRVPHCNALITIASLRSDMIASCDWRAGRSPRRVALGCISPRAAIAPYTASQLSATNFLSVLLRPK